MTAEAPDRNLALELVRVTEAAALAASGWVGRGEKEKADGAAVDAMRLVLDTVRMNGTVVIGEGEKDEAPMLYNGEEVGDGSGPAVDVAVDPLEGTRLTALGQPNAIAVIAVAERGTMFDPRRRLLHGQDRGRARGCGRDRHQRLAGRQRPCGREGEGARRQRGHRRRARARPPREPDPRAARDRRAREPDPRRRRRSVDRGGAGVRGRRHADGDRRHARRASSPPPRSSVCAARSRASSGRATTRSGSRCSTPASISTAC